MHTCNKIQQYNVTEHRLHHIKSMHVATIQHTAFDVHTQHLMFTVQKQSLLHNIKKSIKKRNNKIHTIIIYNICNAALNVTYVFLRYEMLQVVTP